MVSLQETYCKGAPWSKNNYDKILNALFSLIEYHHYIKEKFTSLWRCLVADG